MKISIISCDSSLGESCWKDDDQCKIFISDFLVEEKSDISVEIFVVIEISIQEY